MSVRVPKATLLYAAGVFAAGPFVAALLRVIRTGYDWRYVWVAIAAFVGAVLTMSIGKALSQSKRVVTRLAIIAFLVSTLLAVLMARLLGARANVGIVLVGIVYAVFFITSALLFVRYKAAR